MERLARHAALTTALNAATLLASLALFPLIAWRFPVNETDPFFLALTLPMLVIAPMANAAASVLVPVLTEARREHVQAVESTLGAALFYGLLTAALGALVVGLLTPIALAAAGAWLSLEMAQRVAWVSLWLLPLVLLQTAASILDAGANCAGRFWLPASAGLVQQLTTLLLVAILDARFGTAGLAASFSAGALVHLVQLWVAWPRDWARIRPNLRHGHRLRQVLRLTFPVFLSSLFLQGSVVVTRLIAAAAGPGAVTALDYAYRAAAAITEGLSSGVLVVTLTAWSRMAGLGDLQALRRNLLAAIQTMLFLCAPVAVVAFDLRIPLMETWLARASGGSEFTSLVAAVFGYFALGIPFDIAARLYVRFFLVKGRTAVLATLAGMRAGITIALAFFLIGPFGVPAISAADLLSILAVLAGLAGLAGRGLEQRGSVQPGLVQWAAVARTGFASLAAYAATAAAHYAVDGLSAPLVLPIAAGVGLSAYLLSAWLLRSAQLNAAFSLLRGRL